MSYWISTKQWTKSKARLPKSVLVVKKKKAASKVRVVKRVEKA